MTQVELGDRGSHPIGLSKVVRGRPPMSHGAIRAIAGADVAQDHERRGAMLPALADVGTMGLLTNSVKVQVPHQALEPGIVGPAWRFDLEPARLSDLIERFNHWLVFYPLLHAAESQPNLS